MFFVFFGARCFSEVYFVIQEGIDRATVVPTCSQFLLAHDWFSTTASRRFGLWFGRFKFFVDFLVGFLVGGRVRSLALAGAAGFQRGVKLDVM